MTMVIPIPSPSSKGFVKPPIQRHPSSDGSKLSRTLSSSTSTSNHNSSSNTPVSRGKSKQKMAEMEKHMRKKNMISMLQALLIVVVIGQIIVSFRLASEREVDMLPAILPSSISSRHLLGMKTAPWRSSDVATGGLTRHFLFEEVPVLMTNNGVHMTKSEADLETTVKEKLLTALCAKSEEAAATCRREPEIYKCLTCSGSSEYGAWYSAVSHAGSAAGQFDKQANALTIELASDKTTWRFDIGVPLSQQDAQLKKFCTRLGTSLKKLRWWHKHIKVDVRILVTRYPADQLPADQELALRTEIAEAATLDGPDSVQFLQVTPRPGASIAFSRSQAGNVLHQHACLDAGPDCILAIMDVDMDLSPAFFRNALGLIVPGVSAYTPIVWSEYNPETWHLVDELLRIHENKTLPKFSPHRGTWRQYGFGIYALAGSDAKHVLYKEDFDGWGGEDNVFMKQVEARLHVIRRREKGLTHIWHPKVCDPSFVVPAQLRACVGSAASVEGSSLGLHLQKLKQFDKKAYSALLVPKAAPKSAVTLVAAGEPVLIVVATCRKNFVSRVGTIVQTWAGTSKPPEVTVWFVVGQGGDIASLAKEAGVALDSVLVMPSIVDDEYPPVRKNGAMIQHVAKRVKAEGERFKWILKVDDDTYVNVPGLQKFVETLNQETPTTQYQVWGQRGFGRPGEDREGMLMAGFTKPFCMGGPGYLMNYATWRETAAGMDKTIAHADASAQRAALWHSDIVIGLAVQMATNAGCWDRSIDQAQSKVLFAQNYKREENFVKDADLEKVITMHPLKESAAMLRQHRRYHQEQGGFLIVVITTRKSFVKRALSVKNTWGGNSLPDGASIWYVVGDSKADIVADAKRAQVSLDSVVVTNGISDTSDPVLRSTAMMQHVANKMKAQGRRYDWILRVDDDTFVNSPQLESFVAKLNPTLHQVWGRRGFGQPNTPERDSFIKAGLTKPFCLGGSGYLMSYSTWVETANNMETCLAQVKSSPNKSTLWKADVVIGLCIQKTTKASCWDRDDYAISQKVFLPKTATGLGSLGSAITFAFPEAFLL